MIIKSSNFTYFCRTWFSFKFIDLKGYKGTLAIIQIEDVHLIFRHLYNINLLKRDEIKLKYKELYDATSKELLDRKYVVPLECQNKKNKNKNFSKKNKK